MTARSINLNGINYVNVVLLLFPGWLLLFYFKTRFANWLVFDFLNLDSTQKLTKTLVFFVLTFLKIFLLLILVIFIVAFLRSWVSSYKLKRKIQSVLPFAGNVIAGFSGIAVPYCSCSAVPMFIGFLETGIPLGITFSFLIASPLVNEIILIMLYGLFGLKAAIAYMFAGLSIAIVSGYIIGKLQLDRLLPAWLLSYRTEKRPVEEKDDLNTRIVKSIRALKDILSRTWIYILLGIIIGAILHGYLPESWIRSISDGDHWYSLPLVVLSGIPLYSCSASVAPVAFALVDKGLPLGTALAFIMAVAGLSLPEFIMLRKVLTVRLLLIFAGILFGAILVVGYLFNFILK